MIYEHLEYFQFLLLWPGLLSGTHVLRFLLCVYLQVDWQPLLCCRMWECSTLQDTVQVLSIVVVSIYTSLKYIVGKTCGLLSMTLIPAQCHSGKERSNGGNERRRDIWDLTIKLVTHPRINATYLIADYHYSQLRSTPFGKLCTHAGT